MINFYSTEKREKIPFVPQTPRRVKMYVCGPTVYDSCHIGHARPAVVFDVIRRYLEYSGFSVIFLSNITDIDDKIINRAAELGVSCSALTSRYQDEYESDMSALGVRSPTIRPKATEHLPEMIALIEELFAKDAAYVTSRGVWFDVAKFSAYGKLSGKFADDEHTEHRVETDPEKRHPQDFALWKFAKPNEPRWDSPWGAGRPGWHIECSAMSGKYCGMELDIHGGGADLIFPHHENEIAQSEMATGKKFARYWLHNGFITIAKDGDESAKMGKSKGNAFGLRAALKEYGAAALRFWILGTHYRMPLLYKAESLTAAQNGLARIYAAIESLPSAEKGAVTADYRREWNSRDNDGRLTMASGGKNFGEKIIGAGQKFIQSMNDDCNTPQALAAIFELVNEINIASAQKLSSVDLSAAKEMLSEFLAVLGLPRERPVLAATGSAGEKCVEILLAMRDAARAKKDFAASDSIRDQLALAGIEIKDLAGKTTWTAK